MEPRIVFPGKRDMAKTKLKIPQNGWSGKWCYSYTENGWVKQQTYLDIVKDLVRYLDQENIPRPVILIFDGASCHVSIEMAKL